MLPMLPRGAFPFRGRLPAEKHRRRRFSVRENRAPGTVQSYSLRTVKSLLKDQAVYCGTFAYPNSG